MTQKEALDILKTGQSVFLTGAAGSGKTHVLREYIKYLGENDIPVGITASTGIAATHMGGMTIHAWSGIGISSVLTDGEVDIVADKSYLRTRLAKTTVLIIDEISMLHHFRLDLVDRVLRSAKSTDAPFGGIQVVFCGDFFQLPPITRQGEIESKFAYQSDAWKALSPIVCYLHESHRQNDEKFLRVLHAIRDNEVEEEIGEILTERFNAEIAGGIAPTRLYTHNRDVDTENERELASISGDMRKYEMVSRGREHILAALKKSCLAPEHLSLKVGAKVMFVKNNFEKGYANGTLGVVTKCAMDEIVVKTLDGRSIIVEPESWTIEENGKVLAEINQYPLRLAWAITIHKSQGMSLDAAEIDLSQSFERGMGYVALSRVRTLSGLSIKGMNTMALQVHEEALEMDKEFKKASGVSVQEFEKIGQKNIAKMQGDFQKKSSNKSVKKADTVTQTKEFVLEGKSIEEIMTMRELTKGTIVDHIEKIKERAHDKHPSYS
jgi:ATP-dependent exoDNAse (exonuclease V) alpha subunit